MVLGPDCSTFWIYFFCGGAEGKWNKRKNRALRAGSGFAECCGQFMPVPEKLAVIWTWVGDRLLFSVCYIPPVHFQLLLVQQFLFRETFCNFRLTMLLSHHGSLSFQSGGVVSLWVTLWPGLNVIFPHDGLSGTKPGWLKQWSASAYGYLSPPLHPTPILLSWARKNSPLSHRRIHKLLSIST